MARKPSDFTVTDLFCGAGGSSLGAADAGARIRMAVNHWKLAVESHNANFQDTDHDCTDVSQADPRRYPTTNVLIASPECTSHSLAKGRKRKVHQFDAFQPASDDPSEIRSRATMWDVPRFAEHHGYELVIVENVVDIHYWVNFPDWISAMHRQGYEHRCLYLNSMFFWPTPQSRDRIYVVFWRRGNRAPDLEFRPPAWCARCTRDVEAVQSWKRGRTWGRYRRQYVYCCPACAAEVTPYYYAALNAIDWTLSAQRIGDRRRALRPRTIERIRYGLDKYGRQPLVVRTNMTSGGTALVSPLLLHAHNRDHAGHIRPATEPLGTQTTREDFALAIPPALLINTRNGSRLECRVRAAAADAMGTQTADYDFGVAYPPAFVLTYRNYEGAAGYPVAGLEEPLRTIVGHTQERLVINGAALLSMRDWQGAPLVRHLGEPLPTQIANGPQEGIASRTPFLVSYYGRNQAASVADAMGTLSTRDRHALIEPEPDVEDCYFRMLQPHEIGASMAFPGDYTVLGNKRDRVKQYGNAVTPPAMEWLFRRAIESLEAA